MGTKRIHISLNSGSINNALQEIERYKQDLIKKNAVFAERLKQYGIEVVNSYMKDIPNPTGGRDSITEGTSDYWSFDTRKSSATSSGVVATAIINVDGKRLLYVEFGYGVLAVGSPHPTGLYGAGTNSPAGHGTDSSGWWYTGTDGESHHTHGDVAYAPVWSTALYLRNRKDMIRAIAREVFG